MLTMKSVLDLIDVDGLLVTDEVGNRYMQFPVLFATKICAICERVISQSELYYHRFNSDESFCSHCVEVKGK